MQEIIFRVITDPTARRQALEAGDIDGYDLVAPADTAQLEEAGYNVMQRDPFTILYLGMNQAVPELANPLVREAIAHAIDKEALVTQVLPEGTEVASQFMPPVVTGWNEDVTTYEYDPELAKQLLAEAGYPDGLDAHVQLPDERVAAVHAQPGADLHEPGLAAGGRGDHRHPDGQRVEPGLPRPHPGRRRPWPPPPRLDR